MAIAFRAAGTKANRASPGTGALSVPVPAGTAADDLMLLVATSYESPGNIGINTPSGWTLIATRSGWATDYRSILCWKLAGASEGAASVTTVASSYLDAQIIGFTGVDTTTPVEAAGTWGFSTTGSIAVPSITTLTANARWVTVGVDSAGSATTGSKPSGWTQHALGAIYIAQHVFNSVAVPAAGATTATSYAPTASSGHVVIGVALRESGASAGPAFVPQITIL